MQLKNMEKKIKIKMANNFKSVRLAFLALDTDHDGIITTEDFLKFMNDPELSFTEMQKLIEEKDSNHKGNINYSDFSSWLGTTIYMAEGFFFRHDSVKNPVYEKAMRLDE